MPDPRAIRVGAPRDRRRRPAKHRDRPLIRCWLVLASGLAPTLTSHVRHDAPTSSHPRSSGAPLQARYAWSGYPDEIVSVRSGDRVFVGSPGRTWGWLFERCDDSDRVSAIAYDAGKGASRHWSTEELEGCGMPSTWRDVSLFGIDLAELRELSPEPELDCAFGVPSETRRAAADLACSLETASLNYALWLPLEVSRTSDDGTCEDLRLTAVSARPDASLLVAPPGLERRALGTAVPFPFASPRRR